MILKLATCCLEAPESVVNLTEWRSLCFALDKTRHRQFLWDFLHTNAQILLTEEDLYQSAELIHPSPRAECMFDFSYPVDQCPRLGWQKVTSNEPTEAREHFMDSLQRVGRIPPSLEVLMMSLSICSGCLLVLLLNPISTNIAHTAFATRSTNPGSARWTKSGIGSMTS